MKRNVWVLLTAGILSVALLGLVGSAQTQVPSTPGARLGGTLTVGVSQDFKDLDPRIANSLYDSYVVSGVFDRLIAFDKDSLKPVPYVAKSWEVLSDKVTRFHLNEGIKATNGEPITAEDVAFTFNWMADPANASPNASEVGWIEKVVVVNEYTIDVITKDEFAPFAPGFAQESQAIVPKDTVLSMGSDAFNLSPIGSGPYKFSEWRTGDRIILERNEGYWLVKPNLDKIVFRVIPELSVMMLELESGGIDLADNMPAQDVARFRASADVTVQQCPSLDYAHLFFNFDISPSNDLRFRKACYLSVDMDAAIFSIFQETTGTRAYGCVPPTLWANDGDYLQKEVALEEDDAEAKRLFDELKAEGVIPQNYKFNLYCPPDPRRTQLATIVATNIKENGVDVEVQPLAFGPLLDLYYGSDADPTRSTLVAGIIGWTGGSDPHDFIYYLLTSENATVGTANNFAFYKNPEVDRLVKLGDTTLDQAKREGYYVQAQRLAFADYLHIPCYHKFTTNGVRNRVHGFQVDPLQNLYFCDPQHNVWLEG